MASVEVKSGPAYLKRSIEAITQSIIAVFENDRSELKLRLSLSKEA